MCVGQEYAELQVTTNYSFLRGASHIEELFAQAALLGLPALAVTDRNSLAGIVRAHQRAEEVDVRFLVGCRLDLSDGCSVLVYPTDRPAYARLTRLLTIGKGRAGKGACDLGWEDLATHADGLLAVLVADGSTAHECHLAKKGFTRSTSGDPRSAAEVVMPPGGVKDINPSWFSVRSSEALRVNQFVPHDLARLRDTFGDRAYLALTLHRRPHDAVRIEMLSRLARQHCIATVSPRSIRRTPACCSSVSSAPSGASRPTSMSISSMSGARK
jgi:error-prone DNA polymerase